MDFILATNNEWYLSLLIYLSRIISIFPRINSICLLQNEMLCIRTKIYRMQIKNHVLLFIVDTWRIEPYTRLQNTYFFEIKSILQHTFLIKVISLSALYWQDLPVMCHIQYNIYGNSPHKIYTCCPNYQKFSIHVI